MSRASVWKTFPNYITIFRFLLLIPMLYFLCNNYTYIGFFLFCSFCFFDFLDGYIARKYNQISNFGKIFDPLVDKIGLLSLFIFYFYKKKIPYLFLGYLFFKEIILFFGGLYLLKKFKIIIEANIYGKSAMIITSIYGGLIILDVSFVNFFAVTSFFFHQIAMISYINQYKKN